MCVCIAGPEGANRVTVTFPCLMFLNHIPYRRLASFPGFKLIVDCRSLGTRLLLMCCSKISIFAAQRKNRNSVDWPERQTGLQLLFPCLMFLNHIPYCRCSEIFFFFPTQRKIRNSVDPICNAK